jgi:dihydroneopterin aldolase
MALLKLSRSVESPEIDDHYKDAVAYIAISKTCQEYMQDKDFQWEQ